MAIDRSVIFMDDKYVAWEGIIDGTPKPGTLMQIKAGTAPVGGRLTFEVYAPGTNGEQRPLFILDYDKHQGKGIDDAYVSGTRGLLGVPMAGAQVNVRVTDVAGTGSASDFTVGEILIPVTGTGKFIRTAGTPEMEPFQVIEEVADLTADDIVPCVCTR